MTRGELDALVQLSDFVRDWRREDVEWKVDVSDRLRDVETYVVAAGSREKVNREKSLGLRWRLGIFASVMGTLVSFVLAVFRTTA